MPDLKVNMIGQIIGHIQKLRMTASLQQLNQDMGQHVPIATISDQIM
jgi:hypothetical protein